ncbi:MAG TPA: hypothetical protein VIJ76_01255 [Galbitalea sp.]
MTPILTTPDQTDRAQELIELWMSVDPEAQDKALARLIAATLHGGPGSALERFAGTGTLDREDVLAELNDVRVPLEREGWVDLLGRFILSGAGGRS